MTINDIQTTEDKEEKKIPKLKDIEETIARFGQMSLWLERMSELSMDGNDKKHLKALVQLSIKEFIVESRRLIELIKEADDANLKEAQEIVENAIRNKGDQMNNLFGD